jgi:hypothetical protein
LDQYERYTEKPRHAAFFTAMVRYNVLESVEDELNEKWSVLLDTAAYTAPRLFYKLLCKILSNEIFMLNEIIAITKSSDPITKLRPPGKCFFLSI